MKIVKLLFLAAPALLALALLAAHLASKNEQADDAEREAPIHKAFAIAVDNGVTTLTVDNASQVRSGIQVKILTATQAAAGPAVYGTVVDVQPLLDLSSRYAAGGADLRAAQADLGRRDAQRRRIQALYDDGQNASRKALDAADADAAAARARAASARIAVAANAAALRQQFGPALASWAMAPSSPDLRALAQRNEVLVRVVSMAPDRAAPQSLALSDGTRQPVAARLVSASPQTDPGIQGQAWFYRTGAPLAVGTRLTGRFDVQTRAAIRIPADAVVWYGGQPWAYVRTDGTTFERRRIAPDLPVDGGFIVTGGFAAGEAIVVQGAQLLLSEESRALLRDD